MNRPVLVLCSALLAFAAMTATARAAELRVCSDPDYLPFSNRAGHGFENKLASLMAKMLGDTLVYTWETTRGPGGFDQFLHDTLEARKCDVVIDVPYASENVAPTQPYYISSYVFVYLKKRGYDITSMDSPALKNLRIGYESATPAEDGLKIRALTPHSVPFDTSDSPGNSPDEILRALQSGRIAVAITWEPAIGYYLRSHPEFAVVAVPNSRSQGAPEQYAFPMAMATRSGDTRLRDRLSSVLQGHKGQFEAILEQYGVRLYKAPDISGT
ncbi:MAG: transporter substrate-binding domain-containing protein [Candidatus Eremiobacteraeota bacterium]|nr:transporter substrate-binding domain-containing protein [Candidatus Eremiobacteraeota bacterium]